MPLAFCAASGGSARGAVVLRVAPGWADAFRSWTEEEGGEEKAAPSLVVEESPWVFLPADVQGPWPKPESWLHAQRLLGLAWSPRVEDAPRDPAQLVSQLEQGDAAASRRALPPDRAATTAWDLTAAAVAWERNRAAWWIAWRAARGAAVSREARRRAAHWGLRILPPLVTRSFVCARAERGGAIAGGRTAAWLPRAGAGPRSRRGGAFRSADLAGARGNRARTCARSFVLVFGAPSFAMDARGTRSAAPAPSPRNGTKGGLSPFLLVTVIAHDPRPAALRSFSGNVHVVRAPDRRARRATSSEVGYPGNTQGGVT
jgi:hypothetical protein